MKLHHIGGCPKFDVEHLYLDKYWVQPYRDIIDIMYYDVFKGR